MCALAHAHLHLYLLPKRTHTRTRKLHLDLQILDGMSIPVRQKNHPSWSHQRSNGGGSRIRVSRTCFFFVCLTTMGWLWLVGSIKL